MLLIADIKLMRGLTTGLLVPEAVKKCGLTRLAHTFRFAFTGVSEFSKTLRSAPAEFKHAPCGLEHGA